jgi:hypothetical protein
LNVAVACEKESISMVAAGNAFPLPSTNSILVPVTNPAPTIVREVSTAVLVLEVESESTTIRESFAERE